ncbi:MAG: hypothetical protein Q7K39_00560 [Candidatus Magasanikbacteria bacterium]|nr:hypothetical protein [Candidatus Magasanikbacteria bacterium]
MNNKAVAAIAGALILVAVVLVWGAGEIKSLHTLATVPEGEYSMIYLTNGETYVGKVKPKASYLEVTEGNLLAISNVVKGGKAFLDYRLTSFNKGVLWKSERLVINFDSVVFYAPLLKSSEVVKALERAQKAGVVEETATE